MMMRILAITVAVAALVAQTTVSEGQRVQIRRDWGLPDNVTACRVSDIDLEKGRLFVESGQAGVTSVYVDAKTQIYTQSQARIEEIKIGDKVYVWGTPAVIIASAIEAQDPDLEGNLAAAIERGSPQSPQPPAAGAAAQAPAPVNVGVVGEVVTLDPFTIELADGKKTQILGAASGRITRISRAKFTAIAKDSTIIAIGPKDNGAVKAELVFQGDSGPISRALRDFVDQRRLLDVPGQRGGNARAGRRAGGGSG
jgi:hypothetical protein